MTLYSRHQLLLVVMLVVAAGAGLAIDHWRRARPELVDRLERVDRVERRPAAEERRPPRAGEPRPAAATGARRASEPRRAVATPEQPIDINRASAPELARLPGIGRALAIRIVEARPFAGPDDLARVRGLRPATLERLRPLVTARP